MWLADVKWKECSEYYELALAINPLYMNTWFSLGCAYMRIDEWDKALRAFSRVVSLDPDVLPRLSFLPTASLAKHSCSSPPCSNPKLGPTWRPSTSRQRRSATTTMFF